MTVPGSARAAPDAASERYGAYLILVAGVAIMLPELWSGISWSDSLPYNIVWTEQFRALVRSGDLYPRWLPDSWDGLGSPTFYIYPPLYFWVASILDLLTLHLLSVERLVPLTSLAFLVFSGLAMRKWLADRAKGWGASIGAIAYMAAPYHLNDIYSRGALAEAASYALIPMILIGLGGMAERHRAGFATTSLAYAALILTHLPTALIMSLFLLPWFTVYRAVRIGPGGYRLLFEAALAAALGVGLAAFYVMPALQLAPFISYDALFGGFYRPANWYVWFPDRWPRTYPVAWTILICAAATPLIAFAARWSFRERRRETLFWCAIAAVGVVMALGLVPPLWHLPLVDRVQFPSRFLVLVEFALITALAATAPGIRNPLVLMGAALWSAAMGGVLFVISLTTLPGNSMKPAKLEQIRSEFRDAPEYLPPMVPIEFGIDPGMPDQTAIRLPETDAAMLEPAGGSVTEHRARNGGARVVVRSPVPATLTLRRHVFPHWRVLDGDGNPVPIASSNEGMVRWKVPEGRSVYRVRHGPVPGETLGAVVSGLSLALLLIFIFRMDRPFGMRQA